MFTNNASSLILILAFTKSFKPKDFHICGDFLHTCNLEVLTTVNRGDFGQIFTIFINIFIMMNAILGFISFYGD